MLSVIWSDVYWDIDQLSDMESSLKKKLQEVVDLRDEFVNQKNLLGSVWQGAAGELELYRLEQSKCKFETIICRIETEIAVLQYAIKQYDECEKSLLAKVRNASAPKNHDGGEVCYTGDFSSSGEPFGGGGGGSR